MKMSNTLTLLDKRPDWIEALCREIDTLKFASAFDTFTPDAILAFGVKQITGASAMQAFFVKIDSPLNIDHRILETWDGNMTTFVRGEAEIAKKGGTEHQGDGALHVAFSAGRTRRPFQPLVHHGRTARNRQGSVTAGHDGRQTALEL
jgi:hypothetical protein